MSYDASEYEQPSKRSRRSPKKKRRTGISGSGRSSNKEEKGDDLPQFVSKLYTICVVEQSPHLSWNSEGTAFTIVNSDVSATRIYTTV